MTGCDAAAQRTPACLRSYNTLTPCIPSAPLPLLRRPQDCGMLTFSTPQLQAIVKEKLLGGAGEDTTEYHAFTDIEQSVRGEADGRMHA